MPKSEWAQNISNMFTISIMPNMVGTRIEKIKGLIICMLLDSTYIIPMISGYHPHDTRISLSKPLDIQVLITSIAEICV
jgi:hypothetical protein